MYINVVKSEISYDFESKLVAFDFDHIVQLEAYYAAAAHASSNVERHHFIFVFEKKYLHTFGALPPLRHYTASEPCCKSLLILQELAAHPLDHTLSNMWLHAKALELLVLYAANCDATDNNKCFNCKFLNLPDEREKIMAAKKILLHQLQHPPTIAELSLRVGINQCYLKKGFKELFQTTILGFIQEQRIAKAKILLHDRSLSIADIAEALGYANTSNFTNWFKNATGFVPTELRWH